MLFDLALLSVLVLTGYLGPVVLRRLGPGQRIYGYMLIGDLALAGLAMLMRRSDNSPAGDLVGAVAVGGAICLIVLPSILRDLGRRALVHDRPRLARTLVEFRELLQPGMGARQELDFIDTLLAVRNGKVDAAVELLRDRRTTAEDPFTRRHLDERIVLTYLYARRWQDAIDYFELHIERSSQSISTQLLVEIIRAYCEVGDLESAAAWVEDLEEVPVGDEPVILFLINRARLVFLAFVGRTAAVEAIVAPRGPLGGLPDAARMFWAGVARLKAGDRQGARNSLREAMRLSGRDVRSRQLAEQTLALVDQPGVAGPHRLAPAVAELADEVSARAAASDTAQPKQQKAPSLRGVSWRKVPVTSGLILVNTLAFAAMWLFYGATEDIGALVACGANVKAATLRGEWWRLVSAMFLHVGVVHMALNMYGLWVLGRLVEQFHGSTRFAAIYVVAGLAGGIASTFLGGAATSAGASGAVFGLLGAAIVELSLHHHAYPKRWRSALLGNLLFLAGANVLIGFAYTAIDQAAHIGGLVGGGIVAVVLSRNSRWGSSIYVRVLGAVIAVAGVLVCGYGAWGAASSDFTRTLTELPRVERELGGMAVTAPETWLPPTTGDDPVLTDYGVVSVFRLARIEPGATAEDVLAATVEQELYGGARGEGFDHAQAASTLLFELPPPWVSDELVVTAEGLSGVHRYRAVVFARPGRKEGEVFVGALYAPEALAPAFEQLTAEILTTARPVD